VLEAGLSKETLISIIDDDISAREGVRGLVRSSGFAADAFASAADFLASDRVHDTSCLIVDVNMPRMSGIELHRRLVDAGHAIPTVLITAYPDDRARTRALRDGVFCYLTKPLDEDALLTCVRSALDPVKPSDDRS
jgi:FixJ family two-component response regulator